MKTHWRTGVSPANIQIKCLVPCFNCGIPKPRSRRQLERFKFTFCGTSCQIKWQNINTSFNKGKNNPSFKDGRRTDGKRLSYGDEFTKSLRLSIKIRDGFNCQDCNDNFSGKKSKYLDVHHIDEDKFNNLQSNLICLCKKCHTKRHWTLLK